MLRRRDRLPIEGAEYPDDLPADNDLEYGVRWIRLRRKGLRWLIANSYRIMSGPSWMSRT